MRLPFEYTIIRQERRKTANIIVTPANAVNVTVPKLVPDETVQEILRRKTPWILKKIHENDEVRKVMPKEFVSGETFSYLGRNYRLRIVRSKTSFVRMKSGRLEVGIAGSKKREHKVKTALSEWYQEKAEEKLHQRLDIYRKRLEVEPQRILIKSLSSRWGSCTAARNISFNWRIILAPISIIDYVIVHELCHLTHHDHSSRFWKMVGRILPDYEQKKEWLRVHGAQLQF